MDDIRYYETRRMKAKVTGRHAVTLPAELCRELGIEVGDEVEFEVGYGRAILRRRPEEPVESPYGMLADIFPSLEDALDFLEEGRQGLEERDALLDELWSKKS